MTDSIDTSEREAEDPREPIRLPVREMRAEPAPPPVAAGYEVHPVGTAQRIAELERQVAELRADAERYRWLRDGELSAEYPYPVMRTGAPGDGYSIWAEDLDAAIDAARSAGGEG